MDMNVCEGEDTDYQEKKMHYKIFSNCALESLVHAQKWNISEM